MSTRYNLQNIRTLLTEGFTDEELRRLCYDIPEFRPVYDQLAQVTGKTAIIDRLLEHADRKLQLETLLVLAKKGNPAQYAKHQPYYQANIFISYKRNVEPDEPLARAVHQVLVAAGHSAFIDQDMPIGVEWASEIKRQIEASDFMLVLLSPASVNSEMVANEVEHAHRYYQQTGKARLLPVRVNYRDTLPYQLSHYLDKLQYAEWQSEADTARLIKQLLDAVVNIDSLSSPVALPAPLPPTNFITAPKPYADPRFIESLREPSGAVHVSSEFYIGREGDDRLRRELAKSYGATITIRASRQSGKSSLLIREVAQAQANGSKVVMLDLQPLEDACLESLDSFLRYFVEMIVTNLGLDRTEFEKVWQDPAWPTIKTTKLMEEYILPSLDTKLVLAIDEADRILQTSFRDTFFGLLRSWHNRRARDERWDRRLDIVMAISTEPHLLIKDMNQSPFNVGLKIYLPDFDEPQVQTLNQRYRLPLAEHELPVFWRFLGGHPYLTSKALYTLVSEKMTWVELAPIAATDHSPFGDHLRRYLWLISQQPDLLASLKQIMQHGHCLDEIAFYRLFQAGLVKGDSNKTCTCRCQLYEIYLKERL